MLVCSSGCRLKSRSLAMNPRELEAWLSHTLHSTPGHCQPADMPGCRMTPHQTCTGLCGPQPDRHLL